jgi:phosphohistidine phosphatase
MMNLYLLRHAIAAPRGASGYALDSKRPLTAEGAKKMRRVAKGMLALELSFHHILSSPFVRAHQTAEIVADVFKATEELKLSKNLTPSGNPEALLREVHSLPKPADDVLLVGHEPYLSRLISQLVTGQPDHDVTMKKAGLCLLTAETLRDDRCATLEWLLTPRQLALMR